MGGVWHEDRRRASSFGDDAEQYDRARPAYPAELIDHLVSDHPAAVLDVGCGTGIAARLLAARGCDVLGVEPDHRMAAVARRHGLTVEEGMFEEWDPAGRRFDLLTSAQAWHWVNPERGAARAAQILRPGARIATFWNRGRPPDELGAALDETYARVAPNLGGGLSGTRPDVDQPDEAGEIAACAFRANDGFEAVSTEGSYILSTTRRPGGSINSRPTATIAPSPPSGSRC